MSVRSSVSAEQSGRPTRYGLAYEPTLRLLRVTFTPNDGAPQVGFIPVERIAHMAFADDPTIEQIQRPPHEQHRARQ